MDWGSVLCGNEMRMKKKKLKMGPLRGRNIKGIEPSSETDFFGDIEANGHTMGKEWIGWIEWAEMFPWTRPAKNT